MRLTNVLSQFSSSACRFLFLKSVTVIENNYLDTQNINTVQKKKEKKKGAQTLFAKYKNMHNKIKLL